MSSAHPTVFSFKLWSVLAFAVASVGASSVSVGAQSNEISAVSFDGVFSDDDGSVHEKNIEWIAEQGIDLGCEDYRFCPSETVTRAELAAWLYRAAVRLYGTPKIDERQFSDVAEDAWYLPYARWAVVNGVIRSEGDNFEPDMAVSRTDMAEMLAGTFYHLAIGPFWIQNLFSDVSGVSETSLRVIEGIYYAGVTKGCTALPLQYCPTQKVTRAQAASFLARALQAEIPAIGLVLNEPESVEGYTLIAGRDDHKIYLIDHLGDAVHVWTVSKDIQLHQAKLLNNGHLMVRFMRDNSTFIAKIDRVDRVVWEYSHPNLHHDFVPLSNGNVLLLYHDTKTPEEAIAAGANPDYVSQHGLRHDNIVEIKPAGIDRGEIVWEWSLWDHLVQDYDPTRANYAAVADHPERIDINFILQLLHDKKRATSYDWTHTNAIDYNPVLDQIMLSPRHYSELWIIDHSISTDEATGEKGDLLYRWGNPQSYRAGTISDKQLFWAHDTHWIPAGLPGEGNILVFNNGNEFDGFKRYYSSVDEIIPPYFDGDTYQKSPHAAFGPDQPVWTYTAENPNEFYARLASRAQRLPNGNTLILDSFNGKIFQVTPDGITVWKYINPILMEGILLYQGDGIPIYNTVETPRGSNHQRGNWLYYVEWYPLDYSGLRGLDLTSQGPIELTR